jgi:hypothetical protein
MDYETLRLLAGLLIGLCIAQSILLMAIFLRLDAATDDALIFANIIKDIARGKAKATMHMGQVHITENN